MENAFVDGSAELVVTDLSTVPDDPPPDLRYRHRTHLLPSVKELWARREMMVTLAERDIRSSYKQATLGIGWALLTPIAQLVIFTLIFTHVKSFQVKNVPYPLYAFAGIMAWNYFSSSLSSGGNSMLSNMPLVQKTYFPRACFPLSQMLEAGVYTAIGLLPLTLLFFIYGFAPHVQVLWWAPVFIVVELAFTAGVTLAFSAMVVHVRDLVQVMGLLTQLGLLATPVIWQFDRIPVAWQPVYSFFNPLGPVIDGLRRTMLEGRSPDLALMVVAAIGAALYLAGGYALFKRLEVSFADIT
ncbi:MAG TPA: ABC transporter permease [Acidimicrobiales bacterium]|nr:ABC transporter permease [Acidimicrobiales bacterium]